jgi:hypothetical protein
MLLPIRAVQSAFGVRRFVQPKAAGMAVVSAVRRSSCAKGRDSLPIDWPSTVPATSAQLASVLRLLIRLMRRTGT